MQPKDLPEAEQQILLSASRASAAHDREVRQLRAIVTILALLALAWYFYW